MYSSSLLPLLLVAFSICFIFPSSHANKVVEVDEICKQTTNSSFCSALLNSNLGGKDLVSVAKYTIDICRANLTNTIPLIKSLIARSGNDPKANAHYKNCLIYFTADRAGMGALYAIEESQQYLNQEDYYGLNLAASLVGSLVDDCVTEDVFPDPTRSPFPDTSILPKYVDVIKQVTDIIVVISNLLKDT